MFQPLIFSGITLGNSGGSSLAIGAPIGGADPNAILVTDSSGNLSDKVLTNGQVLIGNTGAAPVAATITGTTNRITVTNGAGSITLSLPQDIATTSNVVFGSVALQPSGSLDTTSAGTLAIGTSNASIINIGNSGSTVNIQGTVLYENVTQLQVKDPLITLNKGGGTGSASNSGIELEENGTITAYAQTSANRASWTFKAPSTAGIATITPGAGGITLNQSSHFPVTIGTANGLVINGSQILSLDAATASLTGALTSTDWNTFNNKQPAGNYITDLSGDVVASGPGSATATLINRNATPGTTGSASSTSVITTNAKGFVLSNVDTPIQISEAQVTNLVSDLAGKQPVGNYVVTNPGDVTPGSFTGLTNNTANQSITGLSFATTVSSFEAFLNIQISATTSTFTTVKIFGTRRASGTWAAADITSQFTSDVITGLAFGITAAGVVTISVGSIAGFTSGTVKYRAISLT